MNPRPHSALRDVLGPSRLCHGGRRSPVSAVCPFFGSFLDTKVLLAASGSARGASRFLIAEAQALGWELVSSDYCDEETRRNLPKVGRSAATAWKMLEQRAQGVI